MTEPATTGQDIPETPTPLHAVPAGPEILRLTTKTKNAPGPQKRVALFYIDDVLYTAPAKVSTNVALRYLNIQRKQGLESAIDYMLETLLGAEGYNALLSYEDLEDEDLLAVVKKATSIMLGQLEAPKEQPPSA